MSTNWSYGIQFLANNYVTPAVDSVVSDLGRVQQYSMNINWNMQQVSQTSYAGFRNLIFGSQMGLFYVSMLAGGMLRAESASIGLEMAQERVNEATRKYGPASAEAHRAMQSLEREQLAYQRYALYSNIMTVSMSLQFVGLGISIMKYAIPSLTALTAGLHTAAAAFGTLYAMMGPWGWAILAGGLAAGIGTATYLATRPVELPNTINVTTTTDLDSALEEYKRRLKRSLQSAGVP